MIEVLAATAVVSILLVALLNLTSSAMKVTESSSAKIQSGGDLRSALDRISADFTSAVFRDDLGFYFEKNDGNDAFYFHAAVDGYGGDRRVSRVGYRVLNGKLERGAEGTGWTQGDLEFGAMNPSQPFVDDANFDIIADRIFRIEVDFLMEGGEIQNSPAPTDLSKVQALIVTLAAIDERAQSRYSGDPTDLAALLPDPPSMEVRTMDRWLAKLEEPRDDSEGALPANWVLSDVTIRSRIFPIRR